MSDLDASASEIHSVEAKGRRQLLRRLIPLMLFSVLAIVLLWGLDPDRDPEAIPSPLIGKPVNAFSLPTLQEPDVLLDNSILTGKVTLLNFWGSWCYVCIIEHPVLNDLAANGVNIVGVNYRDKREDALEWLAERGNPYSQVIVDVEGSFVIDLGVYGAPETFLVDKRGVIRYKRVGAVDEKIWQRDIAPLYYALLEE